MITESLVAADQPAPAATQTEGVAASTSTYSQILRSSALVGGAQILNIGIAMIRTKAMAIMLGPGGFGLFGLYSSILNLSQTLAGLGINSSGVRQIASAVSSGQQQRVSNTVHVLRRTGVVLGLAGAILIVLFSRLISQVTFATERNAGSIRWLASAVFLTLLAGSQTALIQGMRRIADLARMQVLSALFGAVFGIPLVYFFRQDGIVPSLICVAATTITASWWFSRRLDSRAPKGEASSEPIISVREEVASLLKLGVAFMISSLVTLGVSYTIRIIVLHRISIEATGLYQSAWTLGGLYVGFILQAMGADFYPRLTEHADDNAACNRLVNEQALVGLLLAGPGVIASLTFAPLVIVLFYSTKFYAAVGILRWVSLGALLQVVSFPLGYVIIAKARRALFIACELAWGAASIALAWTCISYFGLIGAGIASFASYLFHWCMLYLVVSRISCFRLMPVIKASFVVTMCLVALVFCANGLLPLRFSLLIGTAVFIGSIVYSVKRLASCLGEDQIPPQVRRLLRGLRLSSPAKPCPATVA